MGTTEETELDVSVDQLQSLLDAYPVRLALVFGSHARKDASERSDIDIAVEFDDPELDASRYNKLFLGLGAELEVALSSSVDLVDLHRVDPALAERILDEGILVLGSRDRLNELETRFRRETAEESPLERFDAALERLDGHLA